jgi:glucan-binding YG repeat protein
MFVLRFMLLFVALCIMGMSDGIFAAQRSQGMVTKAEKSLRGTWYSAEGSITFKDNGTVNIKGKRYYYAVSNGGMIQLNGRHNSNGMPYQLAVGKLTLTIDGQTKVYFRKKPQSKINR